MRKLSFIIILTCWCISAIAQKVTWEKPAVGYSSNRMVTLDKIEMTPHKTVVEISFEPYRGMLTEISSRAFLSTGGQTYAMKKATAPSKPRKGKRGNGRISLKMEFQPIPTDSELIHFSEFPWDEGLKLCNIHKRGTELRTDKTAEWQNVEYCKDDSLPLSRFCDDSTSIHVKIHNYVPEAGRMMQVQFCDVDNGKIWQVHHSPINEKGEAEIRLHPCFPLTVLMGVGDAPKSPVVILPGGDLSILIDMGKATDELGAVAFKGTLAETNYSLNVLGMKNLIQYNYDTAYYDSLIYNTKRDCRNEIYSSYYNNYFKIEQVQSAALRELLYVLNLRECMLHLDDMRSYMERKVRQRIAPLRLNSNLTVTLTDYCYMLNSSYYAEKLQTSDRLTYCPLFINMNNYTAPSLLAIRTMFSSWDDKEKMYVRNQYNTDINNLFTILSGEHIFATYERDIKSKDLKEYHAVVSERWREEMKRIDSLPHVHINKYTDLKDEELRSSILNAYAGKRVVFVAYNRFSGSEVSKLDEFERTISASDTSKIVLVEFDLNTVDSDFQDWCRFVTNRPGEHYGSTCYNLILLFRGKHKYGTGKPYYEVYDEEGKLIVGTDDDNEAKAAIK